ncbi:MAG TPA: NnrS family protein, partial [Woeseiaceae bacterium]|nr:NnrS family protein [Woeseiaceae bacterium]
GQRGADVAIRSYPLAEKLVVPAMLGYAVADMAAPGGMVTAWLAALAAALQAWRLSGWQGLRTVSTPIVWILHVAYLWLPVGLALKAAFLFGEFAWAAYWQHALGAGAAGSMILAVMTRAALGHTGRPLRAHPVTVAAYLLVTLAVAVRVFGPGIVPGSYVAVVMTAGTLWFAAFLLYVAVYLPVLLMPRADGKPG